MNYQNLLMVSNKQLCKKLSKKCNEIFYHIYISIGYGLRVKSKRSIDFGKFAEYECEMMAIIKECETCPEIRREQFVIDSGYTFKLKCLPNGKFQSPSWQKCRQPMPCELTPPYPPSSSGLVPYNPYEYRSNYTMMIREFSDVRYECKDEKKVHMYFNYF